MNRLLRDPLLHFLAGGIALFALYGAVVDGRDGRPERVVVSEARVASLADAFARTWMRPPTPEELRGIVDDYVMEEILYREALALGLDRDDLVVRRRMRQKMEFLTTDLGGAEPTEAELAAFLAENRQRFELPARTSFTQVFLDPARSGDDPEARARSVLARLRAGGDRGAPAPEMRGDPTLLPPDLARATARQVADRFGAAFADGLEGLPEGVWSGPVRSGFGLHLVRIRSREPARAPELDEVREAVARELAAERRAEALERFERELRARYEVELPASLGTSLAHAAADR